MKKLFSILMIMFVSVALFSQEALKSTEEEYYDFLSLTGVVERPTLGYRTLSDSVWTCNDVESFEENEDGTYTKVLVPGEESDANIWKNNNLRTTYILWSAEDPADNWFVRGIKQSLTMRIYGPEWFNSYNTAAPYGQNDGALWQGKGYNTALTAGVRFEGYGFEATFKPQLSFSQNLAFELIDNSAYFSNRYAYIRGYGNNTGIDAPQRFGDTSFWNYDWGDSEIRWTWSRFTVGFGTQLPWIGPVVYNPIIHSNNAPSYPKFDIGLKKTSITLPWLNLYIGDIETRIWLGQLTESEYFDNDPTNNHNMINGFYIAYSPSFLEGLTLGATKVCISQWTDKSWKYINPFYSDNGGVGTEVGEDQKANIFASWLIPSGGIEIYGEIGIDDYLQGGFFYGGFRYPFDNLISTFGVKKQIDINNSKGLWGLLIFEVSMMEEPRNRLAAGSSYTYNFHHQVRQGYTNGGQTIGTSLANGGNSQTISFILFYPKGDIILYANRRNPDNTFSFINHAGNNTYKGIVSVGISCSQYLSSNVKMCGGFLFDYIINSMYYKIDDAGRKVRTKDITNIDLTLGLKYSF